MSSDEIRALSGEYALGLLDPATSVDIERRAAREPALATAIAEWRDRLLELDSAAPPLAPPDDLWPRIDAAVDASARARRPAEAAAPSFAARLWGSVTALRGAALAGAAASLALAVFAVGALREAQRHPQVIAVLLSADKSPGAVVEVFADGSSYVAPIVDVSVPNDRTMQVWTLPDPATGPVSLGLLEDDGAARLQPASLPPPRPRQLYEITLEPEGGSPTGRPTGPILFKGFAEKPR